MSQAYGAITGYAPNETDRLMMDEEQTNNNIHLHETEEEDNTPPLPPPPFLQQLVAECIGTCILTQIGCAGLCASTYLGAYDGLWQAAVIWLLGAMLAISATASISGAHLNPAVTVSEQSFIPYLFVCLFVCLNDCFFHFKYVVMIRVYSSIQSYMNSFILISITNTNNIAILWSHPMCRLQHHQSHPLLDCTSHRSSHCRLYQPHHLRNIHPNIRSQKHDSTWYTR